MIEQCGVVAAEARENRQVMAAFKDVDRIELENSETRDRVGEVFGRYYPAR